MKNVLSVLKMHQDNYKMKSTPFPFVAVTARQCYGIAPMTSMGFCMLREPVCKE